MTGIKDKQGKPPLGAMPSEMPDADISMMKNRRLDLRYGDTHPRQVFDIYYPEEGNGPWPVLLHMHGGGFALGDKRDFHIQELLDAVNHGYAFASCNYRRSGDAPFPAAVLDCRRFVDYLHRNAAELNIDADRICAFGGSAGGNLSALFAMNIEKFTGEDEAIDASVTCAVDWFGPTDFSLMDEQARENGFSMADHDLPFSPESKYIGCAIPEADKAVLAAANPISYINPGMKPILLQHGTRDVLVPFAQTELLVDAIKAAGLGDRICWIPLKGAGHDDPMFKTEKNLAILWAFLDKYLKGTEPKLPLEKMPLPDCTGEGAASMPFGLGGATPPVGGPAPHGEFPGRMPDGDLPPIPEGMLFDGPPPAGFKPPELSQEFQKSINEKYLDISYGPSDSQVFDLWMPNERNGRPCSVIIHFHGGAFSFGDKRETSAEPMLRGLERGYAVISAEYRKSGEAVFPAMVDDARTVIGWVVENAAKYSLDADRIALWGPSSGGWLSSYVTVTDDKGIIKACIDWCGPCGGFDEMDKAFIASGLGTADHNEPDSPESRFLGAPVTEAPELVRMTNPCNFVNETVAPFLIIHGSIDQVVPVEQSIAFANAINEKAPGRARLFIVEGKLHHGHPWYHEKWVSDMCLDFLDEVCK